MLSPTRRIGLALEHSALRSLDFAARLFGRTNGLPQHLATGNRGEELALFHLRSLGYIIVARQWRAAQLRGEIDLIAWDGDCLCFIEVKTRGRRSDRFTAEGAVDRDKKRMLRRVARAYMRQLPAEPEAKRFDVVSLYLGPDSPPDFHVFRNAIGWTDRHRAR
jgi:putative endonuclease